MDKRGGKQPGRVSALDGGVVQDAQALFTSQLGFIRRVVRHVAGRRLLGQQDIDDFEAEVHLKLIDGNYKVLRQFQGRSSLSTYLVTVIQRVFLDFQIKRWGKWRPSAAARQIGPCAVELERLVHHEGRTFEEACAILASAPAAARTNREALTALSPKLPVRPPHRAVGSEALEEAPAPEERADAGVLDRERRETARRVQVLLAEALDSLAPEDRLLVKLAFFDRLTLAAVAVMLGRKPRPLYRTLERCLAAMRRHLEARGLDTRTIGDLLAHPTEPIEVRIWRARDVETCAHGPSHSPGAGPREASGA